MNKMMRLFLACIFICNSSNAAQQIKNVTIWLHGTMIPGRPILPPFAIQSFFHKKLGLTPITEYKENDQLYKLAQTLCTASPEKYDLDHYYTFGWSGKLCFAEREQAACNLYHELIALQKEYQEKYHDAPHLRLIAHSHGGNVALNLAHKITPDNPINIDELIVLACPVQDKTKHLMESACFKKVFAFYSGGDTIQVADPQGLYKSGASNKLFSERTFPDHENLYQAQIKYSGRSLMHVEFISKAFCHHLPGLCKAVEEFYIERPADEQERLLRVLDVDTKHSAEIHKKIVVK